MSVLAGCCTQDIGLHAPQQPAYIYIYFGSILELFFNRLWLLIMYKICTCSFSLGTHTFTWRRE